MRQWIRSQHSDFFRKICDHLHEFLGFSRRYPFQVHASFEAQKCQKFLQKGDSFDGHVITIQVMAVADMSSPYKNAVGTVLQGP